MILKKLFAVFLFSLLAAFQMVYANPDFEKSIRGRWLTEITEEIPGDGDLTGGSMRLHGVDEYLGNGVVNLQGQLLLTYNYKNGNQLIASWLIVGASEWQIKNGFLYEKVIDIRATPDFVKAGGVLLSADDQKNFFDQTAFKVEDLIPKGQTTEDEIISIDEKKFSYKLKNDQGKDELRSKTKTNSAFSTFRVR